MKMQHKSKLGILNLIAVLIFSLQPLGAITSSSLTIDGYGLYTSTGSISLVNLSSVSISGNIRSESSGCTVNNVSSFSISGSVVCSGAVRFNNATGSVTGAANSLTSMTVNRGTTVRGGASVVSSITPMAMTTLSAPTSTSDSRFLGPITIVSGNYSVNSSLSLNGTIYATGDITISNGNISGTGALIAGGAVHISNISSLGGSSSRIFIYALGGDIHTNNISSMTVYGTLYAPRGTAHLNNISTANIRGGIFAQAVDLNNISSLTLGAGSFSSSAVPPGISNPSITNACDPALSASGYNAVSTLVAQLQTCGLILP